MSDVRRTLGILALGLAAAAGGASAQEDDVAQAKAIYVQSESGQSPKQGVKFSVILKGATDKKVASTYAFKPGDKMLFQFEVSKPSYVYVLNRTLKGTNTARYAGKAISVVKDEDKKQPQKAQPARAEQRKDTYKVLFPSASAGTNNKVLPGKPTTVPSGATFVMDAEPGIEKLYVIASATPIDIKKYFDTTTGKLRDNPAPAAASPAKPPAKTAAKSADDDSEAKGDEDALDLLNKDLAEWSDNTDLSTAKSLGEGDSADGFGISKAVATAKPVMVEVSLKKTTK